LDQFARIGWISIIFHGYGCGSNDCAGQGSHFKNVLGCVPLAPMVPGLPHHYRMGLHGAGSHSAAWQWVSFVADESAVHFCPLQACGPLVALMVAQRVFAIKTRIQLGDPVCLQRGTTSRIVVIPKHPGFPRAWFCPASGPQVGHGCVPLPHGLHPKEATEISCGSCTQTRHGKLFGHWPLNIQTTIGLML
jgi:hypothetical protein